VLDFLARLTGTAAAIRAFLIRPAYFPSPAPAFEERATTTLRQRALQKAHYAPAADADRAFEFTIHPLRRSEHRGRFAICTPCGA